MTATPVIANRAPFGRLDERERTLAGERTNWHAFAKRRHGNTGTEPMAGH
jgi:hypothetical protein